MQTNLITIMCTNFWTDPIYNPIQIAQATGAITTALAFLYVVKQSKTSKIQQFESTLFNLIDLQNNILSIIRKAGRNGGDVFTEAVNDLNKELGSEITPIFNRFNEGQTINKPIENLAHAEVVYRAQYLTRYYSNYEEEFNHYFRNLYHILKYIHLSTLIAKHRKQFYASLVRAQLSQNQLHVWMFNAMWPGHGNPKALYLIKEYNMFDNFNESAVTPDIWLEYFEELLENVEIPEPFKPIGWWKRIF